MSEFTPGTYETISRVNIRREPRILPGNVVGVLNTGVKREVFSVQTDEDNQTWGRISESDAAGVAQWICLQTINRQYAKRLPDPVVTNVPDFDFMERLANLEAWARTQGYKY